MSKNEGETQELEEKIEAAENKSQTAKGQPAELLYLGSDPNPAPQN